jgi:hypothetical protein
MAKLINYDVSGVESSGGGTGVKAPAGLRVGEIMLCEQREQKADGSPANDIRLAVNVGEDYDWIYTYIGLGPESDWKMAEFVRALGLKDKGRLDPEKMKGKLIRVKVNQDTYEGEYSPRIGRLMAAVKGDVVEKASEISQRDGKANVVEADDEDEDNGNGEAEAFVPSRETEAGIGKYDSWDDADLAAEVEDRGLTVPGGRGTKHDKMIRALRADDKEAEEAEEEEAEEEEAEEEEEEETEDENAGGEDDSDTDYESWSDEDLKNEWEERDLGDLPAYRGRNAVARVKAAIIEGLIEDDGADPFS